MARTATDGGPTPLPRMTLACASPLHLDWQPDLPGQMHREVRRSVAAAAVGWLATALTGCVGLFGPPTITITQRELDRRVAREFALQRRVLGVVDLTLSMARLLPERNRLAATLDLGARDRLVGSRWTGRLDFDAEPRWDPGDRSVRLAQVRVQDLRLDGAAPAAGTTPMTANNGTDSDTARSAFERLGGAVNERLLEGGRVYTLPADRAEQMRQSGYAPSRVSVTDRGIEIGFERVAR